MLSDGPRFGFVLFVRLQLVIAVFVGEGESWPMPFLEIGKRVQFGLHPQIHKVLEVEFVG